jgi:uncharacterized protein YndB with AHSA1/START domain
MRQYASDSMSRTSAVAPPDLSSRPLRMTAERVMAASPSALFKAWTEQLDRWLAAPGTVSMRPEVNSAFFFETHHGEGNRQPYYGRFLKLEQDRFVELTWLSTGTQHVETVITIELIPKDGGTHLRLTHAGFPDEESRDAHDQAWPYFLDKLDEAFA